VREVLLGQPELLIRVAHAQHPFGARDMFVWPLLEVHPPGAFAAPLEDVWKQQAYGQAPNGESLYLLRVYQNKARNRDADVSTRRNAVAARQKVKSDDPGALLTARPA
jgi:hypothetical protein